jgi:hypothetical protein
MTTAKILAIVAVLVSVPSLALAQTVVIVTSPYSGGYAQPYYSGYSYAQPSQPARFSTLLIRI